MPACSGPIVQTAWVVEDIDATERFLSGAAGVRRWTRIPEVAFGPEDCEFRGEPADFTCNISLAYIGDMQLELIQPVRGESIYTEFLGRTGGGLHHICFDTDDLEGALAATDLPVVQRGSMGGGEVRFAYLEGAASGVPYLELAQVSPGIRSFYDSIKRRCA